MTTTIPTPSVPFVPVALPPLADGASASLSPSPSASPSLSPSPPPPPSPASLPTASPTLTAPSYAPPRKPPANDAAPPALPEHALYAKILTDPRIRAFLRSKLRARQLAPADKEDLLSSVTEALWRRRTDRSPALTLPRMLGLAVKILQDKLVDFYRHRDVVASTIRDAPRVHQEDLPPRDKPDDQPNYVDELRPAHSMREDEAFETQQRMAYVNEMAPKIGLTRDDVEVMFAMASDPQATWEELAAERGETRGALRHRIQRLQAKMRKEWSRRVAPELLLTLLILAMMAFFALAAAGLARRSPPPPPVPLPEPTVHEIAPVAPTATIPATPSRQSSSTEEDDGKKPFSPAGHGGKPR
jgi:hypothetical protein